MLAHNPASGRPSLGLQPGKHLARLAHERRKVPAHRDRLTGELSVAVAAVALADTATMSTAVLSAYVRRLGARVDTAREQTIGLRQAINPMRPEEVLTFARLPDQLLALKGRVDEMQAGARKDQQTFENFVVRELNTAQDLTKLVMGIVFAQALGWLYSAAKDRKRAEKSATRDSCPPEA